MFLNEQILVTKSRLYFAEHTKQFSIQFQRFGWHCICATVYVQNYTSALLLCIKVHSAVLQINSSLQDGRRCNTARAREYFLIVRLLWHMESSGFYGGKVSGPVHLYRWTHLIPVQKWMGKEEEVRLNMNDDITAGLLCKTGCLSKHAVPSFILH